MCVTAKKFAEKKKAAGAAAGGDKKAKEQKPKEEKPKEAAKPAAKPAPADDGEEDNEFAEPKQNDPFAAMPKGYVIEHLLDYRKKREMRQGRDSND